MAIHTYGANAVDWEERFDPARLRAERLARLRAAREGSELGALLSFDMANTRYMTATHIGTWAMDKLIRFALLPRGGDPVVWDFGSAARHHQLYNPWLDHTPEGKAGRRSPASTGWPASPWGSTWRRCRCSPPWRQRASPASTASRSSLRPGAPRPGTRSPCSPRRARWWTPPTTSSTSSCAPAFARTSASAWSPRSCTTSAASTWKA